jgi:lipoprotein-anchoring transpeptidase ErfK/SrfK
MEWDGRDDAGNPVPAGAYTYTISATNGTSEKQTETANDLGVTYKRIVVSLSQQRLTAYDDDSTKVLSTLVTTGNPALPTPVGVFPILAKYSPFTFMSSRPPGSKYYYPPAPVTYAMLFDNRGYFIHDAPWRHFFGPGSNAQTGNPGSSYTGSHGCVNVPVVASQKLFKWATVGTVVQVTE